MRSRPDRGYRPHASHVVYQRALGEVCRQRRRIGPQRVRDHTRRGGFRGLRRGADFRAGGLTMALWGKRTGTKIIKSWDMLIKKKDIDVDKLLKKSDDKKSVDAFVKTMQGKKI